MIQQQSSPETRSCFPSRHVGSGGEKRICEDLKESETDSDCITAAALFKLSLTQTTSARLMFGTQLIRGEQSECQEEEEEEDEGGGESTVKDFEA